MTYIKPRLAIKQLLITAKGKTVYDEKFHLGLNIIRGTNSSGKSTITDFLFYVLGGDFNSWKPEAMSCNTVFVEVLINDAIITLKRDISKSRRSPIDIYWGSLNKANESAMEGWKRYPSQRSENKESFSQIIFKMLDFPEVKHYLDSNITIHQILRLLYVDQLTPVDSLMRLERFDNKLTRNTIGEILLGVFDNEVYEIQLKIKDLEKEIESLNSKITISKKFFETAEKELNKDEILKKIDISNENISSINAEISKLKSDKKAHSINVDEKLLIEETSNKLLASRIKIGTINSRISHYVANIEDSENFIVSLENRITALENSIVTRNSLSEFPLVNCPVCLSKIEKSDDDTKCHLCKQKLQRPEETSVTLRMKHELEQQLIESKKLLKLKISDLENEKINFSQESFSNRQLQNRYDELITKADSSRNENIDNLLRRKGSVETAVSQLYKDLETVNIYNQLINAKTEVQINLDKNKRIFGEKKYKMHKRSELAADMIQKHGIKLLKSDIHREEAFNDAKLIQVDFDRDTFLLNGRNQYSASSIALLKNSIHLALLFSSLDLTFFRYPRLLIIDNIEDKGMEPSRSQNFQRVISEYSNKFDVEHQIIFTTSMIDSSLDIKELCVGDKYSDTNKSLKFS